MTYEIFIPSFRCSLIHFTENKNFKLYSTKVFHSWKFARRERNYDNGVGRTIMKTFWFALT